MLFIIPSTMFKMYVVFQVVITSINIDGNLLLIGSHQKEKVWEWTTLQTAMTIYFKWMNSWRIKFCAPVILLCLNLLTNSWLGACLHECFVLHFVLYTRKYSNGQLCIRLRLFYLKWMNLQRIKFRALVIRTCLHECFCFPSCIVYLGNCIVIEPGCYAYSRRYLNKCDYDRVNILCSSGFQFTKSLHISRYAVV